MVTYGDAKQGDSTQLNTVGGDLLVLLSGLCYAAYTVGPPPEISSVPPQHHFTLCKCACYTAYRDGQAAVSLHQGNGAKTGTLREPSRAVGREDAICCVQHSCFYIPDWLLSVESCGRALCDTDTSVLLILVRQTLQEEVL